MKQLLFYFHSSRSGECIRTIRQQNAINIFYPFWQIISPYTPVSPTRGQRGFAQRPKVRFITSHRGFWHSDYVSNLSKIKRLIFLPVLADLRGVSGGYSWRLMVPNLTSHRESNRIGEIGVLAKKVVCAKSTTHSLYF